jgi:hypothetical protein
LTSNLNDYYAVDIQHGKKVGPREWRARGSIFRRDTGQTVKTVTGEGGARTTSENDARAEALRWANSAGQPEGWSPKPKSQVDEKPTGDEDEG